MELLSRFEILRLSLRVAGSFIEARFKAWRWRFKLCQGVLADRQFLPAAVLPAAEARWLRLHLADADDLTVASPSMHAAKNIKNHAT